MSSRGFAKLVVVVVVEESIEESNITTAFRISCKLSKHLFIA
jgi:hypothetical protein